MASITSRSPASPSASVASASTAQTSTASIEDRLLIQFTTVQELFAALDCAPGDALTVTAVSPSSFAEIEHEREQRRRKFRFRRYDSSHQILFITIPTVVHEALHLELYHGFRDKLVSSGQQNAWKMIGTTSLRAQQGHPGGDGGEGDSTGGPRPERASRGSWPTLVVEAGVSQSLAGLRDDMRWWFSVSDHQVQIVLLAKFDPTRSAIILEKWEEERSIMTRPGAMTTSNAAVLRPVLRQTITITQDATTDPVSYNVASGALVLGFERLFLRQPGSGEQDFVLSVQELERYAEKVWEGL